ncbi:hypothetical protein V1509DRAFT_329057 [Lipomyces kononenkoae]
MQPRQPYSHYRDSSPVGDVCAHERMFSNTRWHNGGYSTVKQIVRDLKNLEQSQEMEFMLVLFTNNSSQHAKIFTSAALDGHTMSILPTDQSDQRLKLFADPRTTSQSTTTGTRRSSNIKVEGALPASEGAILDPEDCNLFGKWFNQAGSDTTSAATSTTGYESACRAWRSSLVRNGDGEVLVTAPRVTAREARNSPLISAVCEPSIIFSSPTPSGELFKGDITMHSDESAQVYLSPHSTEASWCSQQSSVNSNPSSPAAQTLSDHMSQLTTQKEDAFLSQAQRSRPPPLRIRAGGPIPPGRLADDGHTKYYPLVISDRQAVTGFLEAKFRQLQQLACKIVAKAWIKVIEPKKQSNHPYNKGEEFKPDWWPSEARHKEPDHLMKPERLVLLVSMLRCGRVELKHLRGATTECAINIPPEKMEVLEEIYYVADMEEQYGSLGNNLGVVDPIAKYNTRTNEDKKQFLAEGDDEEIVVWTIAPEKFLAKSVQTMAAVVAAGAATTVRASSRSLNITASRMPVPPATPRKRSRSEMDIDLSEIQGIIESKRSSYIPCMPNAKSMTLSIQKSLERERRKAEDCGHRESHTLALQDVPATQDSQFSSVIPIIPESTSSTSFGLFTPRSLHPATECQCRVLSNSSDDGPIPLSSHRRYTTGSLQDWISNQSADPSSVDSDSSFTFPPRRHSQQVTSPCRPRVTASRGETSTVGMGTSFDNVDDYPSFVRMLSDVGSSLESSKPAVSSDPQIESNAGYAGASDMSFEADLANINGYAAGFGGMAISTSGGLPEVSGLVKLTCID